MFFALTLPLSYSELLTVFVWDKRRHYENQEANNLKKWKWMKTKTKTKTNKFFKWLRLLEPNYWTDLVYSKQNGCNFNIFLKNSSNSPYPSVFIAEFFLFFIFWIINIVLLLRVQRKMSQCWLYPISTRNCQGFVSCSKIYMCDYFILQHLKGFVNY